VRRWNNLFNPFLFTSRLLTIVLYGRISSVASCLRHIPLLVIRHFLFAADHLVECLFPLMAACTRYYAGHPSAWNLRRYCEPS